MDDSVLNKDKAVRRLSIIDFSSEDDSLLGLAPGFPLDDSSSVGQEQRTVELFESINDNKSEELFEPVDANKLGDFDDILENKELVPQPSESLEPERNVRKNGKYNLRKSLAWDSAFFTCEGVLDSEELSSMIAVDKGQKQMLPGIEEEVHRSTDSISTLESDTLTLESVEANLFEDIRASIQKSSKAINMSDECSRVGSGVRETKVGSASKRVDSASQHKMKPEVASKKPNSSMRNPGKLARPVSACPQLSQSVAASGESNLSLVKRPKLLEKQIPSSTIVAKRASLGGNALKMAKDNVKFAAGRGAPVSKLPGSLRNVPRPNMSSKISSMASSTATTTGATSSFDSSESTSSVKFGKSSNNSIKRKTDAKIGNPNSSGSYPKTPSGVASRNKTPSGKSHLSSQLMPLTKLSSSVSPASSVSDWSSESVSSISSSQQISCSSRDSLNKISCKRASIDFDAAQSVDYQSHTDDQSSVGSAAEVSAEVSGLPGQCALKASTGMAAPPPTSKPSGLRLPSPKIGFFDGVKSAQRTPKRGVPSNLPKIAAASASPRGSTVKAKVGKVNPERAVTVAKPDGQRTSSNMKPKISGLPEASKAAAVISTVLRNVESCQAISPKGKIDTSSNMKPKISGLPEASKTAAVISTVLRKVESCQAISPKGKIDTSSIMKPKISGLPEASKAAAVISTVLRNVESCQAISPEGKIDSPLEIGQENYLKAEEVGSGGDNIGSQDLDTGIIENSGTIDVSKAEVVPENKCSAQEDVKITPTISEGHTAISDLSSISNAEDLTLTQQTVEDASHGDIEFNNDLNSFKKSNERESHGDVEFNNDLNSFKKSNEREKSHSEEDPVACLTRQVEAMEIKGTEEMVIDDSLSFHQKLSSEDNNVGNLSVSPTTYENTSSKRIPFSVKDSLCNIGGSFKLSKGSSVSEAAEKHSQLSSFLDEQTDSEHLR